MAGDYSRRSFAPRRRVSTVSMQQGRVQLDADWNEQGTVIDRRLRRLAADVWGRSWVSARTTPDAFRLTAIAGPDLAIGVGRLYADGLAPEVFPDEAPTWLKQPFLPIAPTLPPPGPAIAYLDVFERELTWVEAPDLLEKALNGVDTSTRRQVAWQVRLASVPNAQCGMDLDALFPPSAARLTTQATATPTSDDPCILPPTGGYRGLENRLYRIQIHVPGPLGTAKFKWSRENASVVSPVRDIRTSGSTSELQVTRIGRDAVLRFSPGDWVEVSDDWRELMGQAGDMARISNIDETTRTLFLDRVVPAPSPLIPFGTTPAELAARHTRVTRWDQSAERHGNAVGSDGLMTTGAGPIALEDGVQALFSIDPAGGLMQVDDHWSFEARTVDGSIRELNAAPPDGVRHHYVPLAVVSLAAGGGFVVQDDCRNLVPPDPVTTPTGPDGCQCCTICIGKDGDVPDLKAALAQLPTLAPDPDTAVRLCLAPGDHELQGGAIVDRPNTWIIGCFPRSRLIIRDAALVLAADDTALIDVVVDNFGREGAVQAMNGADIRIRGCRMLTRRGGNVAIIGDGRERLLRFTVADNELAGAGIGLLGRWQTVKIHGNQIAGCAASAIAITGEERPSDLEIQGNWLTDARGSGIEANGNIDRIDIIDNRIEGCLGARNALSAIAGGIVLQSTSELCIRDNQIRRNGGKGEKGATGIYVAQTRGAVIAGNQVLDNGLSIADGEAAVIDAVANGLVIGAIVIDQALAGPFGDAGERGATRPSLVVTDNVVASPAGHALFVIGEGDIRVQDNSLGTDLAVAARAGVPVRPRDLALVVLIGQLLDNFAEKLVAAAASGPRDVRSIAEQAEAGRGRVAIRGNQIQLGRLVNRDGQRRPLAALLAWGFDDVDLSHNQIDLALREAPLCDNALVMGRTTRQLGNRFTEPGEPRDVCLASLQSHGLVMNSCSGNEGTHCILPSVTAPNGKLAAGLNLVEIVSALCRDGGP